MTAKKRKDNGDRIGALPVYRNRTPECPTCMTRNYKIPKSELRSGHDNPDQQDRWQYIVCRVCGEFRAWRVMENVGKMKHKEK